MPRVSLRGLNTVRHRAKSGIVTTYYYAWKGGPRLPGKPGESAFMAAWASAVASRRAPKADTLAGLVTLYKSKPEFERLAESTKKEWRRWLDRISEHDIGALPLRVLEDPRVRSDLTDWRDEYADRPRAADYGVQVLSRVLGFGMKRGVLSVNRALGIEDLWSADRAELIWDAVSLQSFAKAAPTPVSQALRLACLTGLRRSDLVRLQWSHVGDIAIMLRTGKTGKDVVIPLLPEAKALLAEIGRQAIGPVLRNAHHRPWDANSLSHRIKHFADECGIERSLHDARGTFATRLRLAGVTADEIEGILGWDGERVRRILARYVDQNTIVMAIAERVTRNEARTPSPKPLPKGRSGRPPDGG